MPAGLKSAMFVVLPIRSPATSSVLDELIARSCEPSNSRLPELSERVAELLICTVPEPLSPPERPACRS